MTESRKKIMVVEDDEYIARAYNVKFTHEGFDVSVALDGEEGIKKILAEKPDIIILDLLLPKVDGFGVLEAIKAVPEVAFIPVIVLSNLWEQSDRERAIALGAEEYLVKVDHPIQDVVDKIKKYLL